MSEINLGPRMSEDLVCQFRIPHINSIRDHFLSLYNISDLVLEILRTPKSPGTFKIFF